MQSVNSQRVKLNVIIIRVFICLILAVGSFFWSTSLIDSLYNYRSPLHNTPPSPGAALRSIDSPPVTRRVIFILVDGLREDTSLKPEVMPFLNELRQQGAWATMHSRIPSFSTPSYTTLLTGAWPDLSDGPAMNLEYDQIPTFTQDNLFSATSRVGLNTAVSAINWFEKLIPQSTITASYYGADIDQEADQEVVDAALPWLMEGGFQLLLIHLNQVDYAGHYEGGVKDSRWESAANRVDGLIQEIVDTLDLTRDTLLVTSDHGHIDAGGHGGQDAVVLLEPFMLVGAGVQPGHYEDIQMVDVAPTLATLLGANIPASSQGQVRTEMLSLPPDLVAKLPEALLAQQSQLLEVYQNAIGHHILPQAGDTTVEAYQSALEASRSERLEAERLPRAGLTLILITVPLIWLSRKPIRELGLSLGAGIVNLFLFNLRYAVFDGKTYSLSSWSGANELIIYCSITAFLAMLISWLLYSGAYRIFRNTPGSLDFTLTTIFLISIPVLWSFTLNGALITWTLPDFFSTFVSFLALIQMLIVSMTGLILAGLSAIITARAGRLQLGNGK
jgi:hypothetical protein